MRPDICTTIFVCISQGSHVICQELTGGHRVSGCTTTSSMEISHPIPVAGNGMLEHFPQKNISLSRPISINIQDQLRERHFSIGAMRISGLRRCQLTCETLSHSPSRPHSRPKPLFPSILISLSVFIPITLSILNGRRISEPTVSLCSRLRIFPDFLYLIRL